MNSFNDIAFLSDPSQWPGQDEAREKVCCVKKLSSDPTKGYEKFGKVMSFTGAPPTIVMIVDLETNQIVGKEEFGSVREMVNSGWIVD